MPKPTKQIQAMSILLNKNSILELLLTDSMMQNRNGNVKWDNGEASNSYT
jgi:hypothetical protein